MKLIKTAKELIDKVARKITEFHAGGEKPLISRFKHFNDALLGGLYNGMIVVIAGISGSGKTYFLQQLEEDFLDANLNSAKNDEGEDVNEVVLLRCNWEMTVFKLTIRRLKQQLGKKIREILGKQELTDDEKLMYKEVLDDERKEGIFYLEEPCTPDEFLEAVDNFIQDHKDKKHIIVTVDHIALVRDLFGTKKRAMDQLVENINILKKRYSNVSFLLVSQMNRDIESRTNPKDAAPVRSDLYNTDTIFQIADVVLVRHNPYKLKFYENYMVFPIGAYHYLKEFFEEKSLKATKWRKFATRGLIFYHYLKLRDSDDDQDDVRDLYIDHMYAKKPDYEKGVTVDHPNEEKEVMTSVDDIPDTTLFNPDEFIEDPNDDLPF